ncbi:hypothetical protein ACFLU6_07810, partial [Acidobacteriota bacterium]
MTNVTSQKIIGLLLITAGCLTLIGMTGLFHFGENIIPTAVIACITLVFAIGYMNKGTSPYLVTAILLGTLTLTVFFAGRQGIDEGVPAAIFFLGIALALIAVHLKKGDRPKLVAVALFPAVISLTILSTAVPVFGDHLPPIVFLYGIGMALVLIGPLTGKGLTWTVYPALVLWTIGATAFLSTFHGMPERLSGTVFLLGISTPFIYGFSKSSRWGLLIPGYVFFLLGLCTLPAAIRFIPDMFIPL